METTTMSMDRDELAARCLASLLTRDGYDGAGAARDAVVAADALLAALSPAPVPAATVPTPYAPKVGDVVTIFGVTGHASPDWIGSVGTVVPASFGVASLHLRIDYSPSVAWIQKYIEEGRDPIDRQLTMSGFDLRPATAAERAAAGLPVDAAQQPTPAYPVDDKGRPLWVRNTGKWSADRERPRKVQSWPTDLTPMVRCHVGNDGPITLGHDEWEPCAAPAETPAAALTEEELSELGDCLNDAHMAWVRSDESVGKGAALARAAAAWFAKRGGAK